MLEGEHGAKAKLERRVQVLLLGAPGTFSLTSGYFGAPQSPPRPRSPADPAEVEGSRACSLRQQGCDRSWLLE